MKRQAIYGHKLVGHTRKRLPGLFGPCRLHFRVPMLDVGQVSADPRLRRLREGGLQLRYEGSGVCTETRSNHGHRPPDDSSQADLVVANFFWWRSRAVCGRGGGDGGQFSGVGVAGPPGVGALPHVTEGCITGRRRLGQSRQRHPSCGDAAREEYGDRQRIRNEQCGT